MKTRAYRGKSVLLFNELVEDLHDLLDIPGCPKQKNSKSRQIIHAILNTIAEALKRGEKVSIKGFGTFEVLTRNRPPSQMPGYLVVRDNTSRKRIRFTPASSWTATLNLERGYPLNRAERRAISHWKEHGNL